MMVQFRSSLIPVLFLSLFSVLVCGCGYTFKGSGSLLPQDVKRIYVPLVENSSTEGGLSSVLTESLRDQFERYGVFTVVDDLNDSDAVLKARILNVRRSTRTTTGGSTDSALQYDATMQIAAEIRRVNGSVLWRNQNLAVSKSFGTSKDSVVTGSADFAMSNLNSSDLSGMDTREVARGQEGQSLRILSEQVAKEIYDQAVTPDF